MGMTYWLVITISALSSVENKPNLISVTFFIYSGSSDESGFFPPAVGLMFGISSGAFALIEKSGQKFRNVVLPLGKCPG